jgi:archaellum component FlaC
MADNVTNALLLEHLKDIQAKLAKMSNDLGDLKTDMRGMKGHMASFMQSELAQDNAIAALQERLERIERRLELSET